MKQLSHQDKKELQTLTKKIYLLIERQKQSEALLVLKGLFRAGIEDPVLRILYANTLSTTGQKDAALSSLHDTRKHYPKDKWVRYHYGELLYFQGKKEEGLREIDLLYKELETNTEQNSDLKNLVKYFREYAYGEKGIKVSSP